MIKCDFFGPNLKVRVKNISKPTKYYLKGTEDMTE